MKHRVLTILSTTRSDPRRLSSAQVNALLVLTLAPTVGFCYWLVADWHAYIIVGGVREPKFEMPPVWQFFESTAVGLIVAGLVIVAHVALRALQRHKSLRRNQLGLCPRCGYDIRASPDRCPECGDPLPLDRGPRVQPSTSDDPSARDLNDPIRNAIERGDPSVLRQLVADRPDLAGTVTSDDALLQVAWQLNRPLISQLLDLGVNPDQRDTLGGTVLMYAAAEDDADLVALLLARGADANARNDDGETAFSYACTNDGFRAAKRLHAAGADVNNIDATGASPLDWAIGHASPEFYQWLLMIGCRRNDPPPTTPAASGPTQKS